MPKFLQPLLGRLRRNGRPTEEAKAKRVERRLTALAAIIGVCAFAFLSTHGSARKLFEVFLGDPLNVPLFIAPCVIFGLTVHAYSRFIIAYRGVVAGTSVIGLLLALVFCIGLYLSEQWWVHLRYMYVLFFSYVCWDAWMIDRLLSKQSQSVNDSDLPADYLKHIKELKVVTNYINRPTLVTIFGVWAYTAMALSFQLDQDTIRAFTAGVVTFHLIFSSMAYCLAYFVFGREDAGDSEQKLRGGVEDEGRNGAPAAAELASRT